MTLPIKSCVFTHNIVDNKILSALQPWLIYTKIATFSKFAIFAKFANFAKLTNISGPC